MGSSQSFRHNSSILFKCCPGSSGLRFCITKKYGGAIQRNLFKRRTRAIFQQFIKTDSPFCGYLLYITPLKKGISFGVLQKAFLGLQKEGFKIMENKIK